MTICIFPGTFNPIHIAHIKMAQYALEKFSFEKIIFIPAYIPPHKELNKNLAKHRFNMVKLAVEKNPKFEISDIEYKSEGKSYSLITVKKLIEQYNIKGRINFIIGTDAFSKIKTWYKTEELKELVHFLVFPRVGDIIDEDEFRDYSYELVDMKEINISSTEVREHKKDDTSEEVKEYIQKYELYN